MSRLIAALSAASLLVSFSARAQGDAPAAKDAPSPSTKPAAPAASPKLAPTSEELDPAVRELVRREVEKAKEDMRDEMRAELQGAQSAREFMETSAVGDRPKLDFLQLNGYLRLRSDLFDNFDLHRGPDTSTPAYYLFPRPLRDADDRGTLTSDNMRLRMEPTINVSEQIRVLSQIDMLDNIVLGSTPQGVFTRSDGVQFPFDATGQAVPVAGVNSDVNSISVKRAWAEVQTPVGLLSFGRMPSSWGLGILTNAGSGIDDDLGDSVDRLQFALTPIKTPIGSLVIVPMYEILATGVTSSDLRSSYGIGQDFDRDPNDDAKQIGLKIVRVDTEEEMKRKWERGEGSVNFGAMYMYKSQQYEFPVWVNGGAPGGTGLPPTTPPSTGLPSDGSTGANDQVGQAVRRDASAHTVDVWWKYQSKRFRLESEFAGIFGSIGNAQGQTIAQPGPLGLGPVLLRQFGGATQAFWNLDKFTIGGEAGFASGDPSPGFGYRTGRNCTLQASGNVGCTPLPKGAFDGLQFSPTDTSPDITNFRFNPAYRVDMILFREIIGGVTDAWYLKPTVRYELLEGLSAQLSVIYSQAMYANSTPSTTNKPLGLEFDLGVNYQSDDGFIAWLNYGMLQPLPGLEYPAGTPTPLGRDITRAHAFRAGLAVKF